MKHRAWLVWLVVLGCGSSSGGKEPDAAPPPPDGDTPDAAPPAAAGILDQLGAAEAAGQIDHDTYLLYALYAAEVPALLPEPYAFAEGEGMPEGTAIAAEAQARLPSMTADLQAKFAPLFARPNDPASVFGSARATDPWDMIADDDHHVIYWFNDPSLRPYVQSQMADLAERDVFAHFTTIMGHSYCGDGEPTVGHSIGARESYLDMYFTMTGWAKAPREMSSASGEVMTDAMRMGLDPGCQAPYVIFPILHALDAPASGPPSSTPLNRYTIEHETFHVFQRSRTFDAFANVWLAESTADWATSAVSTDNAWITAHTPFVQAPWSMQQTVGPLAIDVPREGHGDDWYRNALFWYFVATDKNLGEGTIGRVIAAAADQKGIAAAGQVIAFSDLFSEFVLDLYGAAPVDDRVKYRGIAVPITNMLSRDELLANGNMLDLDVHDLPRTAGRYYRVALDIAVKQLAVDLGPLGGKRRVRGVMTMGDGHTKAFDWGDTGTQTFCRDKPEENVKELLIAIADVDTVPQEPLPASSKLHLEAKDACSPTASTLAYDATIAVGVDPLIPSLTSGSGMGSWTQSMHAALVIAFTSRLDSPQHNDFLYDVTGTNMINVSGAAGQNFTTTVQGTTTMKVDTMENVTATGSCSTPSAGSDPLFGESPRPTGSLYIQVPPTGPATYQLDYAVLGVPVSISYHHHSEQGCADPMGAFSTHDELFNPALGYANVMDKECDGSTSTSTNGMGDHPHAGFGYSAMVQSVFHGTFDPDTGHISVMLAGHVPDCANLPFAFPEMFLGAPSGQSKSCSASETMKLDLALGPLERPAH